MTDTIPDRDAWSRLLTAAQELGSQEPWNWLHDSDLFGVRTITPPTVHYCAVLGSLGGHYGLSAFPGGNGFASYIRLLEASDSDFEPVLLEAFRMVDCLAVSFEEEENLEEADRQLFQALQYQPASDRTWPLLRRHEPGMQPRLLEATELDTFTQVLEQAVRLAQGHREDAFQMRENLLAGQVLVRHSRDRGKNWEERLEAFEKPSYTAEIGPQVEERLAGLEVGEEIWEVTLVLSAIPVGLDDDGNRGFYPFIQIVADHSTGQVLDTPTFDPRRYPSGIADALSQTALKLGHLPSRIISNEPLVEATLGAMLEEKGIAVRFQRPLPIADRLRTDLLKRLSTELVD